MRLVLEHVMRFIEERKLIPQSIYARVRKYPLAGKINFVILAATLPMLLLLSMLFLFLYIQLKGQLDATLVQKMIATKNAYNYYERTTLVYAKMLAENPYIKKELLAETINVGPILRVANQVQSSVFLNRVTVHDRKGVVVVRSHRVSDFGDDQAKENFVTKALTKGGSSALLTYEDNNLILQNTVPVYFEGEVVGAITAGYILNNEFATSLSNLTQAGVFFVLNGQIAASSYQGYLENENDKIYRDENRTWSDTRSIRITQDGKPKRQTIDLRFLPIVTDHKSGVIDKVGIAVAITPPFSRGLLYTLIWGSFIFSLAIVLFGIVLALKVGHNIADYAGEISSAMSEYASGNLTRRVTSESADELGLVSSRFNALAAELQKKIAEIEDANENLELKVEERTRELARALTDITSLKEIQEGDYLLTDLLIKPLFAKPISLPNLKVEMLVDQKKKYNFRGRAGDIGGDYCMLASLKFAGSEGEWLFFFNGDAMGKSTQGASGALICGVTLHSLLARHTKGATIQSEPQNYLGRIYQELDHIFSLFDSSMMMSAACGLVHSLTGTMYYFNCEHPWSVLLRKKEARFIENELTMRKLGMPMQRPRLVVKRQTLEYGDVLILGSDGRDDLFVDENIDSDEFRFLAAAEHCEGNLSLIVKELDSQGRRTDDLSLMRIEYHG